MVDPPKVNVKPVPTATPAPATLQMIKSARRRSVKVTRVPLGPTLKAAVPPTTFVTTFPPPVTVIADTSTPEGSVSATVIRVPGANVPSTLQVPAGAAPAGTVSGPPGVPVKLK